MFLSLSATRCLWTVSLLWVLANQAGCQQQRNPPAKGRSAPVESTGPSPMALRAERFEPGGDIPKEFACDGPNASPELTWSEPPAGTQSFALGMEAPDATLGARVHWMIYNIPASARRLAEAQPQRNELLDGSRQLPNDFGQLGYSGPCPPAGRTMRYFFKLYALDMVLALKTPAAQEGFKRAITGHVLAQTELTGVYSRQTSELPK